METIHELAVYGLWAKFDLAMLQWRMQGECVLVGGDVCKSLNLDFISLYHLVDGRPCSLFPCSIIQPASFLIHPNLPFYKHVQPTATSF